MVAGQGNYDVGIALDNAYWLPALSCAHEGDCPARILQWLAGAAWRSWSSADRVVFDPAKPRRLKLMFRLYRVGDGTSGPVGVKQLTSWLINPRSAGGPRRAITIPKMAVACAPGHNRNELGIEKTTMIRVCGHFPLQAGAHARYAAAPRPFGRSAMRTGGLAQGSQNVHRRGGTELPPPQGKA